MLQALMNVTVVIFMVGNLLEVGLKLNVTEALAALRNVRFLVTSVLLCFVVGPSLAVLFTKIIPIAAPYALGLVVLGLAPCSPAIPGMMRRSGGSLGYMSAYMLTAYAGTVVLMPIMVPWLATGFTADPLTIAKPLVSFFAIPLILGAIIRRASMVFAEKAAPIVNGVTSLDTVLLGIILLWRYREGIISSVGSYAIGIQILYYAVLGIASYLLAWGFSYGLKAPMVLGTCTRNVGPALTTLLGVAGAPQGAITMCALAAALGGILSGYGAAAMLRRFAAPASENAASQAAG